MAKAKIEGDIPGIGSISVTGNLATEDAMQDLIAAVQGQAKSQKVETRDLQDNLDDAADSLVEFDDELRRVTKSQDKLTRQAMELAKNTASTSAGFIKTAAAGNSMSDMVESAGDVLAGFAGGLAGMIPVIGEGAARLAEATVIAGTALLSMAVGAVESFQAMNRSIMDGGLLLQGGFSGLADAADIAGLPVNAFGEAIMANISRLRLLEGGAPGGMRRLSQGFRVLQEAQEENLDSLYALGFSQQDVVSGMADVALGAERAGRNLSSEELAAGTFDYLKNLRELNKLTAESAESIQSQVDANRSNLFIQRGLSELGGEQRTAAEKFVAAMEAAGAGSIAAYALTGEISSTQQGLAVEQNRAFADIMRQYFIDLQNGVDPAVAMARYQDSMATNQDLIAAQADANAQIFGQTRELADIHSEIGIVSREAIEQARAAMSGEDPLGLLASPDPETGEDTGRNLSITMGALQGATEAAQAAIQSTFVEGLDRLSGEEGALTRFAEMTSSAAMGAEQFRDAMLAVMSGDYAAAAAALGSGAFGIGGETVPPTPQGAQGSTTDPQNPVESLPGYDPNILPGAATGDVLTGPDSGYIAELHGTEAVVPLPDGRSIPVSLESNSNQNNTDLVNSLANELDTSVGKYTKAVEGLSFDTLVNEIDVNLGKYTKAVEGLSFDSLANELDVNLGKYTKAVEGLSFDTLANELDTSVGNYTKAVEGLSFDTLANELDTSVGNYTKAVEGLSFDTLANEIDINMGKYTNKAFEGLSFESLSSELTQLAATMQSANNIDEETQSITVQDFGTSLDNSRTLSEMLQVNKNMLSQMITNVQKTDQIIRAMENANIISRNTAYVRA